MVTEPIRVFLSYAREDVALAEELRTHLTALVHQRQIRVWDSQQVNVGEDTSAVTAQELASAQVIVPLVSASFLASDRTLQDLDAALRRHGMNDVRLVPILIRACDWTSSPLRDFHILPRSQTPVTSQPNRDEAWLEVVKELRSLIEFSADRVQAPAQRAAPRQIRRIDDIFRTVGQPDITFVEPAQSKALRRCLRTMGKGLVVEGPSGVGKTTLVSRALRDIQAAEHQWLFGQIEEDQRRLERCLSEGFRGHLIVDDFHRLDRPRQAQVADAMKIIADRDARDAKITVIGINPVGDSLVSALRDLASRFDVITMGKQPDEKISELIQKGEDAANIRFRRREEFVLAAEGSFFIAQQLCQEAALADDVEETAPVLRTVDVGFRDVVKKVVDDLDRRYFSDLRTFACHDERGPPRGACLALLWLLAQSTEGHVSLDDVHYRFSDPDVRDALLRLKSSYLSSCFDGANNLKSLLYYNKNAGVLSIEDPRLAFYLRNMSWSAFIERIGHEKNARIDAEGKLAFSRRRPSDRPSERFLHVLHLSDLHFSQLSQADVWYGQLDEDLKELACDRLDVLALSGDLTQRADPNEFEAVRRFLLRLSTDTRLSPGQVVVVPGNHDLSWQRSKAAYVLHRREEYPDPLEEGRYIAHGASVVEVRDEAAYKRRFEAFAEFYAQIKGTPYSLEYAGQIDVQDFVRENLLFVGFNSAWETDHHFTSRASIHPEALSAALDRIRRIPGSAGRLKIAVCHHPLASPGEDRIKDHGFMQRLAKAGFHVLLHGHVHKADRGLFRYDVTADGRRIEAVAAGTFGAPSAEWVPGYPLQYNLLRISRDRIVVETRRREEPNGAWQPDARWLQGRGKDPLPRYEIALSSDADAPAS